MRDRWPNRVLFMLLTIMAASVPPTSWSKEGRSVHVTRQDSGHVRGIVKASAQATLYAQVQGRISQLPYKEGQRFQKGHTLVQLDCDKYRAELAVALAEHEAKDKLYRNNIELGKLNAVSALDLETSATEAKKTFAAIQVAEVNVRGCQIVAPFDGRVVSIMTNEHENVFPNDKLISLLDDSSLEIELVLPSSSLAWIRRQSSFAFVVDETQRSYRARITQIGASIDPASQTIKASAAFEKLPPEILAGMSGTAQFPEQP